MRIVYIAVLVCCMLFSATADSQTNKPSTVSQVPHITALPGAPNSYVSGFKINYVRTKEAIGKFTDPGTFNSQDYTHVKEATQYLDGLGRPIQSVIRQSSPGESPKDMVAPVVYDEAGREHITYLPFIESSGDHTSDGAFKEPVFSDQNNFYRNVFPLEQPGITGEVALFSLQLSELSPLGRPLKTIAPGNSWAGSNRGVTNDYFINNTNDAVKIWTIASNSLTYTSADASLNRPATAADYLPGQLFKNVIKDEQSNAVVEYKDKDGRVILKKVQIGNSIASDFSGYTDFLCTYYVYDDLNQLRFVIPPKAVEWLIANNWNFSNGTGTSEVIPELCFRYEYDARQRMIAKKVPGAEWVYMVYDKRDRLVFTQDPNIRKGFVNRWLTTLYDEINRPLITATMDFTGNRQALQAHVDAVNMSNSSLQSEGNAPSGFLSVLNLSSFTGGDKKALSEINMLAGFESNQQFSAEIADGSESIPFTENNIVMGNPLPANNNLYILTYTFYDNYAWTDKTYTTQNNGLLQAGENLHAETLPSQHNGAVKGLVTGTKVRTMLQTETQNFLPTVNFYDDDQRMIQQSKMNHTGGQDITTNLYDFTGKILSSLQVHNNPRGGISDLKVLTNMKYDHAGRLLATTKKINDGPQVMISENEYDVMGQLKRKKLGRKKDDSGDYTTDPLETLDYTYNIRGWLNGINRDYARSSGQSDRWFGMELNYDWGFTNNQYNGNISGTKWRSRGDGERRAYGFGYDKANRILAADFNQFTSSAWNKDAGIDFSSYMGDGQTATSAYDANGNIKAMKQWGLKGTTSQVVDELTYAYLGTGEYSNKLKNVTESSAINTTDNKLGDFTDKNRSVTEDDYTYDIGGNLVTDLNKQINGIEYSHLGLPSAVYFYKSAEDPGDLIGYGYDALGNKLEKIIYDNAFPGEGYKSTSYVSGFIYECNCWASGPIPPTDNKLQFFGHEEGRVRYIAATAAATEKWVFDYFVKDHLGNTRVVLTDEQQTDAYPAATMETAQSTTEQALYKNVNTTRENKPDGYPPDNYTTPNDKVAKVNGSGNKIGPAILLKVMAGDKFNLRVNSWYKKNGVTPGAVSNPLTDIVTALINGVSPMSGGHIQTGQLTSTILNPNVNEYLNNRNSGNTYTVKPKAYINAILLDDQFKAVTTSGKDSWFEQVGNDQEFKEHLLQGREISKNGYLYIYVSNETENIDVFFDNLQVSHIRGPLVEETHYYPFGLTQAGISSKALNNAPESKYKHIGKEIQNKEFVDGSGLELYDFGARFYDAQIGRWHVQDPRVDKWPEYTPYIYTLNNPINLVDLDGEDVYILYYTTGNQKGDDMFKSAAETRKKDIESGKNFDAAKDKVIMIGVSDISDVQDMTQWAVETFSEKYGKTAEVGVWSHSGTDGPIGTQTTKKDGLYAGSKQMSLDGWSKIDFNWKDKGTTMGFYGCNSANESASRNFAQNISGLSNYGDVEVRGQSTSSYPSFYTNIRATSIARNYNWPGAWSTGGSEKTYMVGGNQGEGGKATANVPFAGDYPKANQMNVYRNRQKLRSDYQPGTQKK